MSFGAAVARSRLERQPLWRRVACLHECLDAFAFDLFGYHETRRRLRLIVGASDHAWTVDQVVTAVGLLEHAHASRTQFLAAWNRSPAATTGDRSSVTTSWLDEYLQGERAQIWLVDDLGDCASCGHRRFHHRARCAACLTDPAVGWSQACSEPLAGAADEDGC
jgi:hypothetical protein